jgi:6-phosphogluconate dehydrogenase
VSSWLVDLIAAAFAASPGLDGFSGRVSDSGEGRWTVLAAVDTGVPAPVISASLYERFESRDSGAFTGKILSAMRAEFGGLWTWWRRCRPGGRRHQGPDAR